MVKLVAGQGNKPLAFRIGWLGKNETRHTFCIASPFGNWAGFRDGSAGSITPQDINGVTISQLTTNSARTSVYIRVGANTEEYSELYLRYRGEEWRMDWDGNNSYATRDARLLALIVDNIDTCITLDIRAVI